MRYPVLFAALLVGSFVSSALCETLDDRIADLARSGDIANTRALVDANGGPNSPAGGTALFHAIMGLRRELVENLLAGGADPNRLSANQHLPLLIAIDYRDPDIVAALLKRGADPNRVGRCLESNCPGHPSLVYAAYCAGPAIVRQLLEAGADVTWARHRASYYANLNHDTESLRLLRAAGAREEAAASKTPVATPAAQGVSALGLTELLPSVEEAPSRPPPNAKCRVAIIASEGLASPADLLTVQLAKEPSLEVVERSELDRILGEQKLTRTLAADPAQAAKVGALLGADALLLLEKRTFGGAKIIQSRFIRVHPGLILDTTSTLDPIASLEAWVASLGRRVVPLATKALAADAVAISIVGLRTSVGTVAGRNLESAFSLLLTDRLVREPRIHLLERTAIDVLSREHALATAGGFWAGSWLIEGTVEAPPDSSGKLSLSLRLSPAQGGEPVLVNVRGLKSEFPALVAEAGAQIAKALIKQPVSTSTDLAAEAQRYLAEAKSAMNCNMHLTAHRAAEFAWFAGLQNFETARLRVFTGARTLQWQYDSMRGDRWVTPEPVRGRVWTADWMNKQLSGQPWLTQREFLDLAIHHVNAWREGLAKLAEATPAETANYFKLVENLVESAAITFMIFDTAAGELDYGTPLAELAGALKEMFDEAGSFADQRPDVAPARNIVSISRTRLARFLYPDEAALGTMLHEELAKHFAEHDSLTRGRIREVAALLGSSMSLMVTNIGASGSGVNLQVRMPSSHRVRDGLIESLSSSTAPEDRFLAHFLALRSETIPEKKRKHARQLFELLWEMRDFFAGDPDTYNVYRSLFSLLKRIPEASEFADVPTGENGSTLVPTAEMHALNVRMTCYLLEHLPLDASNPWGFQGGTNTAEEAAALAAARQQRMERKRAAGLPSYPQSVDRKADPQPSDAPPLKISRLWFPSGVDFDGYGRFESRLETLVIEGDHLWLYGAFFEEGGQTKQHGCLFRIELPSLATTILAMPATAYKVAASSDENEVELLVTADSIFCSRQTRDFSTYDRKSQTWTINEEIKPLGRPLSMGGRVYQLTRSAGVDTLVCIDPARHSVEVLASTQRNPPATPLDDSALEYRLLRFKSFTELELIAVERTAPFDRANPSKRPVPQVANFVYSPATASWTIKAPLHPEKAAEASIRYSNLY